MYDDVLCFVVFACLFIFSMCGFVQVPYETKLIIFFIIQHIFQGFIIMLSVRPGEISARRVIYVSLVCLFVCLLVECRAGDVVLQTAG